MAKKLARNGHKTAVLIPIAEWEKISKQLIHLFEYKEMKTGLLSAFIDVTEIEKGTAKKISLEDFLKEL